MHSVTCVTQLMRVFLPSELLCLWEMFVWQLIFCSYTHAYDVFWTITPGARKAEDSTTRKHQLWCPVSGLKFNKTEQLNNAWTCVCFGCNLPLSHSLSGSPNRAQPKRMKGVRSLTGASWAIWDLIERPELRLRVHSDSLNHWDNTYKYIHGF